MQNLDNYITERLKLTSKSNIYTCQPKDKDELRKILIERLKKDDNADLNDIDVSLITDMSDLFRHLDPHNIDISRWDVSNVVTMQNMFSYCENFNCDLSEWDVRKVKNMYALFHGCKNFNCDLSKWNVSNVTDMSFIFNGCLILDCDLDNWNVDTFFVKTHGAFSMCDCLKRPKWYKS